MINAFGYIMRGIVIAFLPARPSVRVIDPEFGAGAEAGLTQARSRLLESTNTVRETADRVIRRLASEHRQAM
jgi:hypothetical protein